MSCIFDSAFKIGSTHKVCEDYAFSDDKHKIFGISDGCSGSSNTDVGSRIMSLSFKSIFNEYFKDEDFNFDILKFVFQEKMIKFLDLFNIQNDGILDATLIAGHELADRINIFVIGDGFISAMNRNGNIEIYEINYSGNAPYYLTYSINVNRDKSYKSANQKKIITKKIFNSTQNYPLSDEVIESSDFETLSFKKSDYLSVSVYSDGLNTMNTEVIDLVRQLNTFPVPKGEFIKRKFQFFFSKNPDIKHSDDFSMATCYIGQDV